ncbi:MAG: C1 family peptidase [Saprospirales bacterium]|nr:C1 family peptidase [Saprospirales bacterium]
MFLLVLGSIGASAQVVPGGFVHHPDSAAAVPLEPLDSFRTIEPKVSVLDRYPTPRSQGDIGSCVPWAVVHIWLVQQAYRLRFSKNIADVDALQLSASYLYNQAVYKPGDCSSGALIPHVLHLALQRGICPAGIFPNSTKRCQPLPGDKQHQAAASHRIKAYFRIFSETDRPETRMRAVKNRLSLRIPVLVGLSLSPNFAQIGEGDEWWLPDRIDPDAQTGHAFVVVGYDDADQGGAITLMGSFGAGWGRAGFIKIRYADFRQMLLEAYTVYLP